MNHQEMNLFRINTSAFAEEDFLLMTSLTEDQIYETIQELIEEGGLNHSEKDNQSIADEIQARHRADFVQIVTPTYLTF